MKHGAQDTPETLLDPWDVAEPAGHSGQSLTHVIHRLLRGRYAMAILLAVVFAIPLAWIGYEIRKPAYSSMAIIQVVPKLPELLYSTPENDLPPMFDSMVQAEASLIRSRRVLELGSENTELRNAGWPAGVEGESLLENAITVSHRGREQLIYVSATDTDRKLAKLAVNAVLDAYFNIYGEKRDVEVTKNQRTLESRERDLQNKLASIRESIFRIAQEYGRDGLERIHNARVAELDSIERQITALDTVMERVKLNSSAMMAPTANGDGDDVESAAASDQMIESLRQSESKLVAELGAASVVYGPNHRTIKRLNKELVQVRAQIKMRLSEIASAMREGATRGSATIAELARLAPEELKDIYNQSVARRDELNNQVVRLGRKLLEIQKLEEEEVETKRFLSEAATRLEQLRVESQNNAVSRVSILQRGEIPIHPSSDKRKLFSAAGGGFGATFGIGVTVLIGFLKRGVRYIDEIDNGSLSAPLIGTLPELTSRNAMHDEMAALNVHHLRNTLEMRVRPQKGARVFTITSAAAGDGKTSLALALGMSFAVSGRRTLMLDADFVGKGLTSELGLTRSSGLKQAINAGAANGEICDLSVENLWTLPVGDSDELDAHNLSRGSLEHIIDELRESYDTILIDTGPLLGSLEATLVAGLSDGVVITVARGQDPKLVQACLDRLSRLGARCAGLVFNRAEANDFYSSVSAASVCSQSLRSHPAAANQRTASRALVRAVGGVTAGSTSDADYS